MGEPHRRIQGSKVDGEEALPPWAKGIRGGDQSCVEKVVWQELWHGVEGHSLQTGSAQQGGSQAQPPQSCKGSKGLSDFTMLMSFDFHNNSMRQVLLLPTHFREEDTKVKRRNNYWSSVGQDLKPNVPDGTEQRVLFSLLCHNLPRNWQNISYKIIS